MTDLERINDLLAHDDESRAYSTIRSIMLDSPDFSTPTIDLLDPEYDTTLEIATEIHELLKSTFALIADPFAESRLQREQLTELALSLSLCPIHFHDYAICFDDAICADDIAANPDLAHALDYTDECSQIRMIHPIHDT